MGENLNKSERFREDDCVVRGCDRVRESGEDIAFIVCLSIRLVQKIEINNRKKENEKD